MNRVPSTPPAILVVDDDPLLRMFAVDTVEEAGFVAIEARNADQAVAILEARADIVLVLTDINMSGSMDGLKLAHAVSNRWPPIRIIVVSGRMRPADADLPPNSIFMEKPYHTPTLIAEIRSMVGQFGNLGT